MTHRRTIWWRTLALTLAIWIGSAGPAAAQKVTLPSGVLAASNKSAVYTGQLRMASELGRRALATLQAAPTDDSAPLDESVVQPARDTYALIRSARHGMELARENQKISDPLLDLAFKRVDDAWNLSRTPVDKFSWGMTHQQYIDVSVRDLTKALHLVDQVLVLLP
jgi:hypothetical protein